MTKNEIDIDEILKQCSDVKQSKFNRNPFRIGKEDENGQFNKTTQFILPMLGMSYKMRWMIKYLVNAFLEDSAIKHDFVRPVFILMKVKSSKEADWQDFTKSIMTLEILKHLFIMDYYIGQEGGCSLVMFVFTIPDKWAKDFEYFKAGKYSKMSDEYKAKFTKEIYLTNGEKRESQVWGAMHKSDELKDQIVKEFINPATSSVEEVIKLRRSMNTWDEIWDFPNPKEETFRFNSEENAEKNSTEISNRAVSISRTDS